MKNLYIAALGMVAMLWSPLQVSAQEQQDNASKLEVKAQIRPRAEYRNGALGSTGSTPAFFVNNRARLSAYYTDASGKLTVGMSGQNVSVWGATPQVESVGTFMLNEAWAELKASEHFAFRIGRQQLAYDDDRILGTLDWQVSGRWHDAFLTKMKFDNFQAHVGLAFNQNAETKDNTWYNPTGAQPYKTMQFLWMSQKFNERFSATALLMNLGFQKMENGSAVDGIYDLQTLGANLHFKEGAWKINGTFYKQLGQNNSGQGVNAHMLALKAIFAEQGSAWSFAGGLDYLSGNDAELDADGEINPTVKDNTQKAFDPLFGTHHKFYGFMDYFYVGNHGRNIGLFDKHIGATYKVNPKLSITGTAHHFNGAGSIKSESGATESNYLGTEADFSFKYKMMKDVVLMGGFSQMFGTDALNQLYPGTNQNGQNWGWLMININPTIFSSKF